MRTTSPRRPAGSRRCRWFEAVEESGGGAWLESPHGDEGYLYLGDLHGAESVTWENSKALFANLLHYGLIRTNLRDAVKARAG